MCDITFACRQAKESWEMDVGEKIAQSKIMKEKGTKYFQVSMSIFSVLRITQWYVVFRFVRKRVVTGKNILTLIILYRLSPPQ
jgi:hypothetical protein